MARVNGITEHEATQEVKALFQNQSKLFGDVLNITSLFALRPAIMARPTALAAGIYVSVLIEPPPQYMVYTKTAWIYGLPFLIDINASRRRKTTNQRGS